MIAPSKADTVAFGIGKISRGTLERTVKGMELGETEGRTVWTTGARMKTAG